MISPIAAALAVGASATIDGTEGDAISNTYKRIVALLKAKFGSAISVEGIEQEPHSAEQQEILANQLQQAGAHEDGELLAEIKTLIALLKLQPQQAKVVGVNIEEVEAAFIKIGKVYGAGVNILKTKVEGGIEVGEVSVDGGVEQVTTGIVIKDSPIGRDVIFNNDSLILRNLSAANLKLLQMLAEKDKKIEELRGLEGLNRLQQQQLADLEKERTQQKNELSQNPEMQQQNLKDKNDLKRKLAASKDKDTLKTRALEQVEKGNYEEAKVLLRTSAKEEMAKTAVTFYELGKVAKLQFSYREAFEYFNLAVKIDGENKDYLFEAGDLARTLGDYKTQIDILERLIAKTEFDSIYRGLYFNNIGEAWLSLGEHDKAINYFEEALAIYYEISGEDHGIVSDVYNNLGFAFREKGDYDKAISFYKKGLAIGIKFNGEYHAHMAILYNNLGGVLRDKGDYYQAITYLNKAIQVYEKIGDKKSDEYAAIFPNLGVALQMTGEYNKAINRLEEALVLNKSLYGENHSNIAFIYSSLGTSWEKKGDLKKAIDYYNKALFMDKKIYGEDHHKIAIRYNSLASVWFNEREFDKTIDYCSKALAIDQRFYGENHPNIAMYYSGLGLAWLIKGEHDKAINYFEKSLTILLDFLPANHQSILTVRESLRIAQWKKDKPPD